MNDIYHRSSTKRVLLDVEEVRLPQRRKSAEVDPKPAAEFNDLCDGPPTAVTDLCDERVDVDGDLCMYDASPSNRPASDSALPAPVRQSTHFAATARRDIVLGHDEERKEEDPNVCFGTITEAMMGIPKTFSIDKKSLRSIAAAIGRGSSEQQHCPLSVQPREHYFVLQTSTGDDVAILDKAATKVVQALRKVDSVHLLAYPTAASGAEGRRGTTGLQAWDEPNKKGKVDGINVDLVVFGRRTVAHEVGKILSRLKACLQHPEPWYVRAGVEYENPHFLRMPGAPPPTLESLPTRDDLPTPQSSGKANKTADLDIDEVFESINNDGEILAASIDHRVKTPLLDHQKRGVYFMCLRESDNHLGYFNLWRSAEDVVGRWFRHDITGFLTDHPPREAVGGIIADDMGLGKTLTVLATIVNSLDQASAFASSAAAAGASFTGTTDPSQKAVRATLVVVPSLLLLRGWQQQINEHVAGGTLHTAVYHGQRSHVTAMLPEYDVVLTTYDTVRADVSKRSSPLQSQVWYRIVLDEAHSIRSQSSARFSAMMSLSARFRWCLTGTPVQNKLEDLGALVRFLRIPQLDSPRDFRAHIIDPLARRHDGDCSGGTTPGSSDTGRPESNLRALLNAICLRRTKGGKRSAAMSSNTTGLAATAHSTDVVPPTTWMGVTVTEEFRFLDFSHAERERYFAAIEGNKRAIERGAYGGSQDRQGAFNAVLRTILRLRILCNHGTLDANASVEEAPDPARGGRTRNKRPQQKKQRGGGAGGRCDDQPSPSAADPDEELSLLQQQDGVACSACTADIDVAGSTPENPTFVLIDGWRMVCSDCAAEHSLEDGEDRATLNGGEDDDLSSHVLRDATRRRISTFAYNAAAPQPAPPSVIAAPLPTRGHSTKINALLADIEATGAGIKSIVFTFWTRSLLLVASALASRGTAFACVFGKCTAAQRVEAIERFAQDPSVAVLLMTTGTGSEGLNLTMASQVYLLEPQWNPSIESQAIGRVARIGQTRRVRIVRFIMRKSVEEGIRARQRKKIRLAALTTSTNSGKGSDVGDCVDEKLRSLMDMCSLQP